MTLPARLRALAPTSNRPPIRPDDLPLPFGEGVAITVWGADGLRSGTNAAIQTLRALRPDVVQLHAGPQGLADHLARCAEEVRAAVPGVRIWVGVAWDGWVDDVAEGADVRRVVDRVYLPAAKAAAAARAELLVVNSEAAGKLHPKAARSLGVAAIDAIRAATPSVLLGHTAFDHPHYHPEERNNGGRIDPDDEGYPWSAYLGARTLAAQGVRVPAGGPVALALPQRYCAPPKDPETGKTPRAGLGALPRRILNSRSSWERATVLGWIADTVPVRGYFQLHHTDPRDMVQACVDHDLFAGWALPTRADTETLAGLRVGLRARRGELSGGDLLAADRVLVTAAVQAIVGAKPDGNWGPASTRAAGAWLAARSLDGDGRLTPALLAATMGCGA